MSAVIIPFPDEETRELLMNGYYWPEDIRRSGFSVVRPSAPSIAAAAARAAYETEIREEGKRYHALRAAGVPSRCLRALASKGASTLADVASIPPEEIKICRNVGVIAMGELRALLLNSGFTLSPEWDDWDAQQEARQG